MSSSPSVLPARLVPASARIEHGAVTRHASSAHLDRDHRLAEAFEAAQELYFLWSPAEGLELAVSMLEGFVPCDGVSACLYDINTDELRFVSVRGPGSEHLQAAAVPSTAGLMGAALHGVDDVLLVERAGDDRRYDAAVDGRDGLDVGAVAYFPLRHADDMPLGMLQLVRRRGAEPFSDEDLAVAGYLAKQLADFLQQRRRLGPRRPIPRR